MVVNEWIQHKRKSSQYIMDRVAALREESMNSAIAPKLDLVEELEWAVYLRELRYNYYN